LERRTEYFKTLYQQHIAEAYSFRNPKVTGAKLDSFSKSGRTKDCYIELLTFSKISRTFGYAQKKFDARAVLDVLNWYMRPLLLNNNFKT